jgi:hypothetical protein
VFFSKPPYKPQAIEIGHTGSNPEEVSVGCECGRSIQVAGQAPHIVYTYIRKCVVFNKGFIYS